MLQVLEQPGRSHNVARAAEPWLATLAFVGALLDEPEHPREGGAELAQPRVVRHHEQVRRRVQHAGRVEQGSCHQRGGGVQHAELILENALGHRGLEVRRQPGGPLVDRAEYILPAVGAGEAERLRLTAAAPPHRSGHPSLAKPRRERYSAAITWGAPRVLRCSSNSAGTAFLLSRTRYWSVDLSSVVGWISASLQRFTS